MRLEKSCEGSSRADPRVWGGRVEVGECCAVKEGRPVTAQWKRTIE